MATYRKGKIKKKIKISLNKLAVRKEKLKKKLPKISDLHIKEHLAWIPNFCTFSNLSLGFFSILLNTTSTTLNSEHLFVLSSIFIFLAMFFDGFDGFMARALGANSNIGAQLDSLADLVAFGIAPAVLMYSFVLNQVVYTTTTNTILPVGMFIAAIWPICASYRLARFNVRHATDFFEGLPSPVAGSIIALMTQVFHPIEKGLHIFLPICIYIFCAFLMVSTIKYSKPQITLVRHFSKQRLMIIFCILFSTLSIIAFKYGFPIAATFLFTIGFLYIVAGVVSLMIHTIQKYRI